MSRTRRTLLPSTAGAAAAFPLTTEQEATLAEGVRSGIPHALIAPAMVVTGDLDFCLVDSILRGDPITVPDDPAATAAVARLQADCQDVIRRMIALSRLGDPDEAALARTAAYLVTTPEGIARAELKATLDEELREAARRYR